jgi:hypothetical protein
MSAFIYYLASRATIMFQLHTNKKILGKKLVSSKDFCLVPPLLSSHFFLTLILDLLKTPISSHGKKWRRGGDKPE